MKYVIALITTVLSSLLLVACKQETMAPQTQAQDKTVSATLMYRERMAAPEGSTLTVQIRDISIADKPATIISEEIVGLGQGNQLPLSVSLELPTKELKSNHRYSLFARLDSPQGQLMWITTQEHAIDTNAKSHELGDIMMQRVQSGAVTPEVDSRYPVPFKAGGNEPGWSITVSQEQIKVETQYGQNSFTASRPIPQPYKGGYKYHLETPDHNAIVDINRKLCYDNMSGRPHPARVVLTLDGQTFKGCGGDPSDLLVDKEWAVASLNGTNTLENSRVTINFTRKGRAYGVTSCNNYSSAYELTGESLIFKMPINTKKACAPELMQQEQRFLSMLSKVTRYDIDNVGALILTTSDGKRIIARH